VSTAGICLARWGVMRPGSIIACGVGVAFLMGPAIAQTRPDTAIHLDWSASELSGPELATAALDGTTPDLQARFPGYDLDADDFLLAMGSAKSPDAMLFERESFTSETLALAGDMHLRLAEARLQPDGVNLTPVSDLSEMETGRPAELPQPAMLLAGAEWDFASWGGLGIAGSQTRSDPFSGAPGRFELAGDRFASMLGVSAHLNFGDGWVTSFSYDEGKTQLDLRPNVLAVSDDTKSDSVFGVGVAKNDLFGEDALALDMIRPVQPNGNNLVNNGNYSGLLGPQISLSSATPETDFQLDYETSFNGNVTLQANAGYQMNVAGQNGTRAISVLSRAKINF
jgi:hypothetical protein